MCFFNLLNVPNLVNANVNIIKKKYLKIKITMEANSECEKFLFSVFDVRNVLHTAVAIGSTFYIVKKKTISKIAATLM